MKSLYSNLNLMSMVSALNEYFSAYFHAAARPMRRLLCGIVLAMLAFESTPSIRWMYTFSDAWLSEQLLPGLKDMHSE